MGRIARYAVIFWVALTANFLLPRLMPGSPLPLLAGADLAELTTEQRATLLADAGLDRPIAVQYARYLGALTRGDLGHSFQRGQPVATLLAERLPWTLLLTLTSQALAVAIGLSLGTFAAWHHARGVDSSVLTGVLLLEWYASPSSEPRIPGRGHG